VGVEWAEALGMANTPLYSLSISFSACKNVPRWLHGVGLKPHPCEEKRLYYERKTWKEKGSTEPVFSYSAQSIITMSIRMAAAIRMDECMPLSS